MPSRRQVTSTGCAAMALGAFAAPSVQALQSVILPIQNTPPDYNDDELAEIFADNGEPVLSEAGDYVVKGLGDWPLWWNDDPLETARWPTHENTIDYAHLPPGNDDPFLLSDATLRQLAAAHSYTNFVNRPFILFGVRGAKKTANSTTPAAFEREIAIVETKPDHFEHKCLLGVWDTRNKKIWAIAASTVPHVAYLYAQREAGTFAYEANMMPTGLYRYTVGTHRNRSKSAQPGAFRPASKSFAVLRCLTDGPIMMGADKYWDIRKSNHGDNIHAGTYSTRADRPKFWSAGCQVMPGYYSDNDTVPQGDWARFRIAAGLRRAPSFTRRIEISPGRFDFATSEDNRLYNYLLTTGRDVRLAAADESEPTLRFGSRGKSVKEFQAALGVPRAGQDGIFGLGTQKRVLESGEAQTPIVDRSLAVELGMTL